jgi:hypothetical protein
MSTFGIRPTPLDLTLQPARKLLSDRPWLWKTQRLLLLAFGKNRKDKKTNTIYEGARCDGKSSRFPTLLSRFQRGSWVWIILKDLGPGWEGGRIKWQTPVVLSSKRPGNDSLLQRQDLNVASVVHWETGPCWYPQPLFDGENCGVNGTLRYISKQFRDFSLGKRHIFHVAFPHPYRGFLWRTLSFWFSSTNPFIFRLYSEV